MRLTQVLWKRRMHIKPPSHVRQWQWNNAWYIAQERPVYPLGLKQVVERRGGVVHKPEDLVSPLHPAPEQEKLQHLDLAHTRLGKPARDETHPLWKDTPAYTYNDRTWLPKNSTLTFASAITNTETVAAFSPRGLPSILDTFRPAPSHKVISRVENLLKDVYAGDAVQKLLPRDFRVPYIGWHPVEDKMTPRNLYDHTKASWGRSMPREYGVPKDRKLRNLSRGLFMESLKMVGEGATKAGLRCSVEKEAHCQFVRRADGKLVRLNLRLPMSVYGAAPLPPLDPATAAAAERIAVPDVAPLDPCVSLHATNIYQDVSSHPVTSLQHTAPHTHCVLQHYTAPISARFVPETELSRGLMAAYTVALGQARLRYGQDVSGDLPAPVRTNVLCTDGQRWMVGSLQLHSADLGPAAAPNLFCYNPEPLTLFSACGYEEGSLVMEGLNMNTFATIISLLTEGVTHT